MLTHEMFTRIVDKVNNQYGKSHFLPAEYLWQDGVHIINAYGTTVWSSENCTATSESTIEGLVYRYINTYILTPVWKVQVECMKDDVLWEMKDKSVSAIGVKAIEEYFDNELEMLGGR